MLYLVTWEINLDADSPREAAEKALEIHRDKDSTATVFKVWGGDDDPRLHDGLTVDLSEEEEKD